MTDRLTAVQIKMFTSRAWAATSALLDVFILDMLDHHMSSDFNNTFGGRSVPGLSMEKLVSYRR